MWKTEKGRTIGDAKGRAEGLLREGVGSDLPLCEGDYSLFWKLELWGFSSAFIMSDMPVTDGLITSNFKKTYQDCSKKEPSIV